MSDDVLIQLFCLNLLIVFIGSLLYYLGVEALTKPFARTKAKSKSRPYF